LQKGVAGVESTAVLVVVEEGAEQRTGVYI
jgi:hypothetical protein